MRAISILILIATVSLNTLSAEQKNPSNLRDKINFPYIKIKNLTIEKENFPEALEKKLLKTISTNRILTLLKNRYSFLFSNLYPSPHKSSEIKITISKPRPKTPIIYATVTLNPSSRPFSPLLQSKISVEDKSYKSLIPGIGGEIAYMVAKLHNFKVNTETSSPVLETYITGKEIEKIFRGFRHSLPPSNDKSELKIYSIYPYTLQWDRNGEHSYKKMRGISLLTSLGFISLGSTFNLNMTTVRDLAFQQSHQGSNRDFDTIFTDNFNNLYLFSSYSGKLKKLQFDTGISKEKTINLPPNSIFLKSAEGMFILVTQPPKSTIMVYPESLSNRTAHAVFSIPFYTNFFSTAFTRSIFKKTSNTVKIPLLYLFDTLERRIRIIDPTGREIDSIKPIYNPQTMPMPNLMKFFSDGSFILSGSGIIIKFDRYGLPLWKIDSYTIKYLTSLPPLLKMALIEDKESIYVLDDQRNIVLKYSYNQEKISKIKKPTGAQPAVTPIELANLFEKLATEKLNQLVYPMAKTYYNYAISIYRKIRLQYPLELRYSTHLTKLVEERNRIINALTRQNTLKTGIKGITLNPTESTLLVTLNLKNLRDYALDNVKIEINIPYLLTQHSELLLTHLKKNESRDITINLKCKTDLFETREQKLPGVNFEIYIKTTYTLNGKPVENLFQLPLTIPFKQ